jgi:membrane associated rhomboid family serine protease
MRSYRQNFKYPNVNLGFKLKRFIKNPSPLHRLIVINIVVYFGILCLKLFFNFVGFLFLKDHTFIFQEFVSTWLCVPADLLKLGLKPWTLFTSIFLHMDFFHIFFNMIMLWFSGSIFLYYFRPKSLYTVYILGGIIGNLLFILSYNYFPVFEAVTSHAVALGASGGVLAILIAAATKAPNQQLNLLFFGNISLKWIAIVFVILDIISIPRGNSGGHFAHLGGALFGFLFAYLPKNPIRKPVFTFHIPTIKSKPKAQRPKTDEQYNRDRAEQRKKVDEILDKVAKSGYQNLTKEEKDFLFTASHNKNL